MIQCCICGAKWKSRQTETKPRASDDRIVYGCRKCHKGFWEKNCKRGDFDYGEWTKEKK